MPRACARQVLKLLRLLRLARVFRFFSRFEEKLYLVVNNNTLRMAKLTSMVMVYLHWMASILFMTASLAGFPDDSWASPLRVSVGELPRGGGVCVCARARASGRVAAKGK